MASVKLNEMWLVAGLVVIAAVFAVMAFTKDKGAMEPQAVAVEALMEDASTVIKPDHSEIDQASVAAFKPVPAVVMPPQQVTSRNTLAVQVYSFKEKSRADVALEKLKAKGYRAYILVSDLGERGIWYRVRVGTFSSEEDARKALEAVLIDFKNGIIVTE